MLSHNGCGNELTGDERAVLAAGAGGMISIEIAESVGQPVEQTRLLIATAIQKLGARSKFEATVLALRRGLILLPD